MNLSEADVSILVMKSIARSVLSDGEGFEDEPLE